MDIRRKIIRRIGVGGLQENVERRGLAGKIKRGGYCTNYKEEEVRESISDYREVILMPTLYKICTILKRLREEVERKGIIQRIIER